MREMKDSGIEWIGIIPKGWNISRLKYIAKFFNGDRGKNYPSGEDLVDDGIAFLTSNNIHGIVLDCSQEKSKFITEERYNRLGGAKIQLNDIAFCLRGSVGNCAINKTLTKGTVASSLMIIRPIKASSDFINYVLQTDVCDVQTIKAMNGSCAANLSAENVSNYYFVEPSIVEQKKIAIFLDSKCSEIDAISADIQKEIETLEQYKRSVITEAVTKGLNPDAETKKSTIFYMAPYNFEWRLSKIGYECTKLARPFSPADTPLLCTNKGKVSPRPSDMTGKMVSEDNAMQGIHKGDIAIHGMDTWHGAIAMSEYDGKITRVVHVCDSKQDKRFIVYYLQQLAFNDVYKLISFGIRGNTSDFRSWDKVKDIYIALPDIDEQQKISDFLDLECRRVEDIVSEKKKQLDVLDAYKKSLIYEYVTGKKEVPAQN